MCLLLAVSPGETTCSSRPPSGGRPLVRFILPSASVGSTGLHMSQLANAPFPHVWVFHLTATHVLHHRWPRMIRRLYLCRIPILSVATADRGDQDGVSVGCWKLITASVWLPDQRKKVYVPYCIDLNPPLRQPACNTPYVTHEGFPCYLFRTALV